MQKSRKDPEDGLCGFLCWEPGVVDTTQTAAEACRAPAFHKSRREKGEAMCNRRSSDRFEPFAVSAQFKNASHTYSGFVLDSSEHGIAVTVPKSTRLPEKGSSGMLILQDMTEAREFEVGCGIVARTWMEDDDWGYALNIRDQIANEDARKLLLSGTRQQQRIQQQSALSQKEMAGLDTEIRSLKDCVLRMFIISITTGAILGSSYLGLAYHGAYVPPANPSALSFWRTMLAAFPGILAIIAALIVTHKVIMIIRTESFLSVLKEGSLNHQFPREYRGWQAAVRKLRLCWNSNLCTQCGFNIECGKLRADEEKWVRIRGALKNPSLNIFYTVVYGTFGCMCLFSFSIVFYELWSFQWGILGYSIISMSVELLIVSMAGVAGYLLWQLRKGKYTFETTRRIWLDLLMKCPYQP